MSQFNLTDEQAKVLQARKGMLIELRTKMDEVNESRNKKKVDIFDEFISGPSQEINSQAPIQATVKMSQRLITHLGAINQSNAPAILEQIEKTNIARFLIEASNSLVACKIDQDNILLYTKIVGMLHYHYKDFMPAFMPKLIQVIDSDLTPAPKKRNLMRIYGDLLIAHATNLEKDFVRIFHSIISPDIAQSSFKNHKFIWGIIAYCGGDLLGINRGPNTVISSIFNENTSIPGLRGEIMEYYKAILSSLQKYAIDGQRARKEASEILINKGIAKSGKAELADKLFKEHTDLTEIANCYSFLIGKPIPKESKWIEETQVINVEGSATPIIITPDALSKLSNQPPIQACEMPEFYTPLTTLEAPIHQKYETMEGIRRELDRCTKQDQVDELSCSFVAIVKEADKVEKCIELMSSCSKYMINQTPYYARFVANINTKYPEIGPAVSKNLQTAFASFITRMSKNPKAIFSPKLHIARYVGELAKFNIGINDYFDCLSYTVHNFRGKTIDMANTLIITAGKYLNTLEIHRIRLNNLIQQIKKIRDNAGFPPHMQSIINQAVYIVEPPEVQNIETTQEQYNVYQDFVRFIFRTMTGDPKFAYKAKRLVYKAMNTPDSDVTLPFILQVCLDLPNIKFNDLNSVAVFVKQFTDVQPKFAQMYVDILIERIRRGIEVDNPLFHQRQILEVRMLGLLALNDVIKYNLAFKVATMILSLDMPNPKHFFIQVSGRKSRISQQQLAFFRATLVVNLLDVFTSRYNLLPHQMTQTVNNVFYHLQLFCLIRAPIPSSIAFQITDLLKKVQQPWFETIEQCKEYYETHNLDFVSTSTFNIDNTSTSRGPSIVFEKCSDDEDSMNSEDEAILEKFEREEKEFRAKCAQEKPAFKKGTNKVIPMDLMTNGPAPVIGLDSIMTTKAPPPNFVISVKKEGKINEFQDIRFTKE